MNHVVPPSLLFDFRLQIPTCPAPSKRKSGRLLSLADDSRLFIPGTLNNAPNFAQVRAAWNPDGVAVSVHVRGKSSPLSGSVRDLKRSDCVYLWFDMRPAGNVHRATEFCQHFACLPADKQNNDSPSVHHRPIAQQRDSRAAGNTAGILCRSHTKKSEYEVEVWIPAAQLHGFEEISELRQLGFYCVVQDLDLGEQHLIVGEDFPYSYDPSTWLQLDLMP